MENIQETATELKKKGGVWRIFLSLFIFLFLFFSILLYFALQYLLQNWSELTVDEILYHIKAPMGGANGHLVHLFLLTVLLPALLLTETPPRNSFYQKARTISLLSLRTGLLFCDHCERLG